MDMGREQDLMVELQTRQTGTSVQFFQAITDSISFVSLGIPSVFLFMGILRKKRDLTRKGLMVLLCIGLSGLLSYAVKRTMHMPRPYEVDTRILKWSGGTNNSFPSGHTVEATSAALGFSLVLFRTPLSIFLSAAWALLIMFTRIVLGVHNFTDIAAGITIGCIGFLLMQRIFLHYSPEKVP
jgi:membrane-associated phospholipid phosphatase